MSNRLSKLRGYDPVLTQLSREYKDPNFIADKIFPEVSVAQEAGKIMTFGIEAFKQHTTNRSIRASSNRIMPEDITYTSYALEEHDIEIPLDWREASAALYDVRAYAARQVKRILQRALEVRTAAIAFAGASYGASNKVTLAGTDQWTHASSNPIAVIEAGREALRASIGVYPNVMLLGAKAYAALKSNAKIESRLQYGWQQALTEDTLGKLFDIPTVIIGRGIQSTDAGVKTDIWADNCLLAYVAGAGEAGDQTIEPSFGEPSLGYTVRLQNGLFADMYEENGGKVEIARATDVVSPFLVGADAGYLIIDTNV